MIGTYTTTQFTPTVTMMSDGYTSFSYLPERVTVKSHFIQAGYACEVREIQASLNEERKENLRKCGIRVSWLNGYVRVPSTHPYAKLSTMDIPVNVHGGVTCLMQADDPGYMIFGFDTQHGIDGEENLTIADLEVMVKKFADDLKKGEN